MPALPAAASPPSPPSAAAETPPVRPCPAVVPAHAPASPRHRPRATAPPATGLCATPPRAPQGAATAPPSRPPETPDAPMPPRPPPPPRGSGRAAVLRCRRSWLPCAGRGRLATALSPQARAQTASLRAGHRHAARSPDAPPPHAVLPACRRAPPFRSRPPAAGSPGPLPRRRTSAPQAALAATACRAAPAPPALAAAAPYAPPAHRARSPRPASGPQRRAVPAPGSHAPRPAGGRCGLRPQRPRRRGVARRASAAAPPTAAARLHPAPKARAARAIRCARSRPADPARKYFP